MRQVYWFDCPRCGRWDSIAIECGWDRGDGGPYSAEFVFHQIVEQDCECRLREEQETNLFMWAEEKFRRAEK